MKILCLFRHKWAYVGMADFGRGRLERCERCRATRLTPMPWEEIRAALEWEVREVKRRPKAASPSSAPIRSKIHVDAGDPANYCEFCLRPVNTTTPRCPGCGAHF